jgi:hypothetical protein
LPEAVAAGASAFTRSTQRNANTHVCSLHDAAGQRAVMRRLTPSAAWLRTSWLATGARGAPRWVGATCNAYAEVASMRQRSWQCTCARSQKHILPCRLESALGRHTLGRAQHLRGAAPKHAHHRTHRRTEPVVPRVHARSVQRSLDRCGGGARCGSRCAAASAPRGAQLARQRRSSGFLVFSITSSLRSALVHART